MGRFADWNEATNDVAASWRVELNPYGIGTSGCHGKGTVTAPR